MAYTKVQFIGYVIDTAPQLNPDGSQTYLGLNNPQLDIEARCDLMLRAMQTAHDALPQQSPPSPPGEILKIFMAPEFFFRGAAGAYQMDDVQVAIKTLQDMAADSMWTDWILVFGTILGVSSPTTQSPPYDIDPLANKEVYNFTLVQEGGAAAQGDTGARVVMKELKSDIDFIAMDANPGGLLLGDVEHLPASSGSGPGREKQQVNYDGAGVFELAGITWGLEVCLDHEETVNRLQKSPQLPGENQIQIQLVPSCGMGIEEPSVIVETGGYVFNCDGYRGSRHSSLAQLVPPLNFLALTVSSPVSAAPIVLQSTSPAEDVSIADLYANGPGVINIYAAQTIPAQQKVPGTRKVLSPWVASADYQFNFQLVYDESKKFVTLVCEIQSKKTNFYHNEYFLPLMLQTQDAQKNDVLINMKMVPGSSPYAGAVWCKISVPGFLFEGNAFQFSATLDGPDPQTIW